MKPSARWAAAPPSLSGCVSDASSLQPCATAHSSAAATRARPTPRPRASGATNHPSRYATRFVTQPSAHGRSDSSAKPTARPASSATRIARGSGADSSKNRSTSSWCPASSPRARARRGTPPVRARPPGARDEPKSPREWPGGEVGHGMCLGRRPEGSQHVDHDSHHHHSGHSSSLWRIRVSPLAPLDRFGQAPDASSRLSRMYR